MMYHRLKVSWGFQWMTTNQQLNIQVILFKTAELTMPDYQVNASKIDNFVPTHRTSLCFGLLLRLLETSDLRLEGIDLHPIAVILWMTLAILHA